MKMYAIRMNGTMKSSGNSTHFKGIKGFDAERCALKCNKAEKVLMLKAGYDIEEDVAEFGSKWLTDKERNTIKTKINKLDNLNAKEEAIRESIIKFIEVCEVEGYVIRLY